MVHRCCKEVQSETEHSQTATAVLGSLAKAATEICTKMKLQESD